jgi:hypothetical protein
MHGVHTFPSHFPKIHCNIIFPSTPGFSKWSFPFRFRPRFCVHFSSLLCVLHALPKSSTQTIKQIRSAKINMFHLDLVVTLLNFAEITENTQEAVDKEIQQLIRSHMCHFCIHCLPKHIDFLFHFMASQTFIRQSFVVPHLPLSLHQTSQNKDVTVLLQYFI